MPVELIDTHAHLDSQDFHGDLPEVLGRAADAGVSRIISIATTAASAQACVELAAHHSPLSATVGLPPNITAEEPPTAWDDVVALVGRDNLVALGETDLDRHWHTTPF